RICAGWPPNLTTGVSSPTSPARDVVEADLPRAQADQLAVTRVPSLAPLLVVAVTLLSAEVAVAELADQLLPLGLRQRLDQAVTHRRDHQVGPLRSRHGQRGPPVGPQP